MQLKPNTWLYFKRKWSKLNKWTLKKLVPSDKKMRKWSGETRLSQPLEEEYWESMTKNKCPHNLEHMVTHTLEVELQLHTLANTLITLGIARQHPFVDRIMKVELTLVGKFKYWPIWQHNQPRWKCWCVCDPHWTLHFGCPSTLSHFPYIFKWETLNWLTYLPPFSIDWLETLVAKFIT